MKLVTVKEMKEIEEQAIAKGLSVEKMMAQAGLNLAHEVEAYAFGGDDEKEVLGLIGTGNNGGDTLIALKHLKENGWQARAYLINRKEDEAHVASFVKAGGEIFNAAQDKNYESLSAFISSAEVILDGILGTGIRLPLKADVANVLNAVNQTIAEMNWPPYVVAVDCPSGTDCDTGEIAPEAIPASMTVSMAAVKQGLLKFPASDYVGELRVAAIGIADNLPAWTAIQNEIAEDDWVAELIPERPSDSHKGTFGSALIVAGSARYLGAAYLAGKAAYRAGAGLVQMAVPAQVQMAIAAQLPEATWFALPSEGGAIAQSAVEMVEKNLGRATALLLGPGLGEEETTEKFVEALIKGNNPNRKNSAPMGFIKSSVEKEAKPASHLPAMVIDADGLRLLAKLENWPSLIPAESVLTPHLGEMAELTGLTVDEIKQDRLNLAKKFAMQWKQVVVLKGAFTVIAAPTGHTVTIPVASSALAHAGTGDVLAGMITAFLAQGASAFDSAAAGAYLHAQAGLIAAEKIGSEASVMAGDLIDSIGDALSGY